MIISDNWAKLSNTNIKLLIYQMIKATLLLIHVKIEFADF